MGYGRCRRSKLAAISLILLRFPPLLCLLGTFNSSAQLFEGLGELVLLSISSFLVMTLKVLELYA